MICQCCHLIKSRQYCATCIQEGVTSHLQLAHSLRDQCSTAIAKAERLNSGASSWRKLRSEIASQQRVCDSLKQAILAKERELEPIASNAPRPRATLAKHLRAPPPLEDLQRRQNEVSRRIAHARTVLVKEVISIFGLRLVAGVWTIAGLPIPPPSEFRLVSSASLNAALMHVVHLLALVTRYLSITLPFIPTFPKQPHVGRPILKPNLPYVSTTKFREKIVLWMSTSANKGDARSAQKHRQFLVAFGLLSHSVSYLAWSQGVEGIGVGDKSDGVLVPATSVLHLLQAISDSSSIGLQSNEPGTSFLKDLGFGLDVTKVVAATTPSESGDDQNEGWDIIDAQ